LNILLLEDDVILNELIEEYLLELNFSVDVSFDGYEAQDLIYSKKYDLYIFDVNVPNLNGFELLAKVREDKNNTPAIFITSMNTSKDMQKGFSSGADDYIKKPFELEELGIRINNIKRLYSIEDSSIINISNNIIFDTEVNNLKINNKDIHISKKEAMILKYFVNNHNKVISIEELCANVWEYDNSPTDATIRTYIKNIRNNLGEKFITNIKGIGYKFNN